MRRLALSLTTILLLVGGGSDAHAMSCQMLPPTVIARCPPLATYTSEESRAIGRALADLRKRGGSDNAALIRAIEGCYMLREACRVYQQK